MWGVGVDSNAALALYTCTGDICKLKSGILLFYNDANCMQAVGVCPLYWYTSKAHYIIMVLLFQVGFVH